MSATISWRPTYPQADHQIRVGSPSSFITSLQRAFCRTHLRAEDIVVLRGMAAATKGDVSVAYAELADAIEAHGEIEWMTSV